MSSNVNHIKDKSSDSDLDSSSLPSDPKKIKMTANEGDLKLPAGLELVYQLERQNVHNGLDAFVLTLHWTIVRAGLRIKSENAVSGGFTERLPANWSGATGNDTPTRHLTFDYFFPEKPNTRYQVRVVELTPDDQVVVTINVTNGENTTPEQTPPTNGAGQPQATPPSNTNRQDRSASTYFIGDFIKKSLFAEQSPELERAISVFYKATELERQLWGELMEPINIKVSGVAPLPGPYEDHTPRPQPAEQPSERARRDRNLGEGRSPLIEDRRRPQPLPMGPLGGLGRIGPPSVGGPLGRSDLDPLGGVGAGMLADPRGFRNPRMGPGGLNPGQMPPGARFDPFGPPNPARPGAGTGQWAVPNPDHEPPPPGFDDMFM